MVRKISTIELQFSANAVIPGGSVALMANLSDLELEELSAQGGFLEFRVGGELLEDDESDRRDQRGVFRSVADLKAAITRFLAETNSDPKPFVWTADPKRVLAAVKRGKQALASAH